MSKVAVFPRTRTPHHMRADWVDSDDSFVTRVVYKGKYLPLCLVTSQRSEFPQLRMAVFGDNYIFEQMIEPLRLSQKQMLDMRGFTEIVVRFCCEKTFSDCDFDWKEAPNKTMFLPTKDRSIQFFSDMHFFPTSTFMKI